MDSRETLTRLRAAAGLAFTQQMKHLRSTCGSSVEAEWREYDEYLKSLRGIPASLAEFARVNSHDAWIVSVAHPSKNALAVTLSGFAYEEFMSLTFSVGEVIREFIPEKVLSQAWWGHEITLVDPDLFEIRAKTEAHELFVCGRSFAMEVELFRAAKGCPRR